ncbi:MAG: dienelactone hydrolase family protein [Sulfobacillus sp.]
MRDEQVSFVGSLGQTIPAFVAVPDDFATAHPAVIVIHEIWGLDDHIRGVARRLAAEGYLALAPQLYVGEFEQAMRPERIMAGMQVMRSAPAEVQRDPRLLEQSLADRPADERAAIMTLVKVMSAETRKRFRDDLLGAVSYLEQRPDVDPDRIASLGFCMGGGLAVALATKASNLWKTVIFYGDHPPLEDVPAIHAQVLGLYGGTDARITDNVPAFSAAMAQAGRSFTSHVYPGAGHAFFNDSRPAAYHQEAAHDAWLKVKAFLAS